MTLIDAAKQGDIDLANDNINLAGGKDRNGMTALMHAAYEGHWELVKRLVEHEMNYRDKNGRTALMHAAKGGKERCVSILVQHEAYLRDMNGRTALMYAAENGSVECARLLLGEAALVTTRVTDKMPVGVTALMFAVKRGNFEVAELLKPQEALIRDSNDHDALWYAKGDKTQMSQLLSGDCEENTIYLSTTRLSSPNLLSLVTDLSGMIRQAIDLIDNVSREEIRTTLHIMELTTSKIMNESVSLDTEFCQLIGWTPLMTATVSGDLTRVKGLLSYAQQQTTRDAPGIPSGLTALMLAAYQGHIEIVTLLAAYEKGLFDNAGRFAYNYAMANNQNACAQQLIGEAGMKSRKAKVTDTAVSSTRKLVSLDNDANLNYDQEGFPDLEPYPMCDAPTLPAVLPITRRGGCDSDKFLVKSANDINDAHSRESITDYRLGTSTTKQPIIKSEANSSDTEPYQDQNMRENPYSRMIESKIHLQDLNSHTDLSGRKNTTAPRNTTTYHGGLRAQKNNLYAKDTAIKNPLMDAASNGRVNDVKCFLDEYSGRTDNKGRTALMYAALNGHKECASLLLTEAGKQTIGQCGDFVSGATAMIFAAVNGHYDIVEMLREREANIRDSNNRTPDDYLSRNLVPASTRIPTNKATSLKDTEDASRECYEPPSKQQNHRGVHTYKENPNTERRTSHTGPRRGATTLSSNSDSDESQPDISQKKTGRMLEGLEMQKKDRGWTKLMYDVISNNCGPLSNYGADLGKSSTKVINGYPIGTTALMIAATKGYSQLVRALSPHESKSINDKGHTALVEAMIAGQEECARLLLPSELNVRNKKGDTQKIVINELLSKRNQLSQGQFEIAYPRLKDVYNSLRSEITKYQSGA
ncbi:Ankyrin repeat protein 1 [Giardia muris]|uniref:Ankyrin repeat protein 1 n=1 Tax=Giardia muris TaxID=5742 RepID=A0A4Z1T4S3_GIAMU|nr:Ankyrin repeat protein 1 [Giardia muris]|eukprot:TNJ30668.1 Ankyrin repeat protein 1 [Giardia muris]